MDGSDLNRVRVDDVQFRDVWNKGPTGEMFIRGVSGTGVHRFLMNFFWIDD